MQLYPKIKSNQSNLHVIITPGLTNSQITSLASQIILKNPQLKPNETLVKFPLEIAKIPTARYDGNVLKAFDLDGEILLDIEDDEPVSPIISRTWRVTRRTNGDVRILVTALPRTVDHRTKTGPAFDLRISGNGIMGSGYAFLPLPEDGEHEIDIELEFDLTHTPEGFRAVWTNAESLDQLSTKKTAFPSMLHMSMYMIGDIKFIEPSTTQLEKIPTHNTFGMYWLASPPFPTKQLCVDTLTIFNHMCSFFGQDRQSFRIFLRRDPYRIIRSGVALPHCFTASFGTLYDGGDIELLELFTHEMTHNWLTLNEEENARLSLQWYAEGLAEYYSVFFRQQLHRLNLQEVIDNANQKVEAYYTSPIVNTPSSQLGKETWKSRDAQRLPYGRGFTFFVRLNALIKRATSGKRSLDDLVKDMKPGQASATLQDFFDRVDVDLGPGAGKSEYDDLASGKLIIPPETSLIDGAKIRRVDLATFDLGFDEDSLNIGEHLIRGLKPGSRAEEAGLRDGDKAVDWTDLNVLRDSYNRNMIINIKRSGNDEPITIDYWPRARTLVEAYQWDKA